MGYELVSGYALSAATSGAASQCGRRSMVLVHFGIHQFALTLASRGEIVTLPTGRWSTGVRKKPLEGPSNIYERDLRLSRSLFSAFTEAPATCAGHRDGDCWRPMLATAEFNRLRRAPPLSGDSAQPESGVDLHWLPLGAGGHFVRFNGRLYEAVAARLARRPVCDLYHSALEVRVPEGRFVIESAPIRTSDRPDPGVVGEGAVGSRWAGWMRIFRYELRFWRDGVIPDIAEAVDSPRRLTDDPAHAQQLLALASSVPTPVWGRDELHAGEMWNSNSFISWLIARSGLDTEAIRPPMGGRAPGWDAGLVVARRQQTRAPWQPQHQTAQARAGSAPKGRSRP
jgi:hypothetical protein